MFRWRKRFFIFLMTGIIACSFLTVSEPVWAVSQETELKLSLEEAVKRAIARSHTVRLAEYNVEQGEISREEAASKVNWTPLSGGNDEASRVFLSLVQQDINLQVSKQDRILEEDSIAYQVYQKYTEVLSAQEKLKAAEIALEYAQYQHLAAQIGFSAGTVSWQNVKSAQVNYNNQESNLAQSHSNLEQSYVQLNELIGLNGKQRPVLTDDLTWSPLEVSDLDLEITRRLSGNPTLWKAQKSVELAELSLQLYTVSGEVTGNNYRSRDLDISKAELSAAQTKAQLQQSLRNTYASICSLQEQYNTQQQALKLAEEQYQGLLLKYEMGLIPKGDLLASQTDLSSKGQSLKALVYQHELLKMKFAKPWV